MNCTFPSLIIWNAFERVSGTNEKFKGGSYCIPTVANKYLSKVGFQDLRNETLDPKGTPPMTIGLEEDAEFSAFNTKMKFKKENLHHRHLSTIIIAPFGIVQCCDFLSLYYSFSNIGNVSVMM
jgi:hypothetical protein